MAAFGNGYRTEIFIEKGNRCQKNAQTLNIKKKRVRNKYQQTRDMRTKKTIRFVEKSHLINSINLISY